MNEKPSHPERALGQQEPFHGVVVVDKPVGPSSFAVVRRARHGTGASRVGHGGTLDPRASGVLPICFGEATKLAQFLLDADKEYEATISFGIETDTYDADGEITARRSADHLRTEAVRAALIGFVGEQLQVPPMYSALKRDGRPLYAYARAGQTLDRPPRPIRIHTLELRAFESEPPTGIGLPPSAVFPRARIFLRCSKGTYVRSLAHDLGRVLGTGAYLAELRRTRSGPFGLEHAVPPEALSSPGLPVISPAMALAHLTTVTVSQDVARAIERGQPVTWGRAGPLIPGTAAPNPGLVRILAPGGQLLAVAPLAGQDDPVRTLRVFRIFGEPASLAAHGGRV